MLSILLAGVESVRHIPAVKRQHLVSFFAILGLSTPQSSPFFLPHRWMNRLGLAAIGYTPDDKVPRPDEGETH